MIKLYNLSKKQECIIEPTVFPDGTSQVWNIPTGILQFLDNYSITWYFESEAEIMQLIQLRYLLANSSCQVKTLFIPFFPYSRQDKSIHNTSTFALCPFLDILTDNFKGTLISTLDVHNKEAFGLKDKIDSLSPAKYILKSLIHAQADLVCYPDKGAKDRYAHLVPMDHIIADKVRDQATGKITGHTLQDTKHDLKDKTVLIVDDICDGGRTFTSMAKMLKEAGVANIDLYVTHGIFSMGVHVLNIAGIRNIYTTDSYSNAKLDMRVVKQYKVEEY